MKIVLTISSLGRGGRERQVIELLHELAKCKLEFYIVTFSKNNSVVGIGDFIDQMTIIDRKKLGNIIALKEYFVFLSKIKPDIIHTWDLLSTFYSVASKIFLKSAIIDGTIRGAYPFCKRKISLTICSPFLAKIVANSYAGLKSANRRINKKNIVIHNGINLDRFNHDKDTVYIRRELNLPTDVFVIGMVANIRKQKDYKTYIKVAYEVLKNRKDVIFISIGSGVLSDSFYNEMSSGIRRHIYFLGKQERVEEILRIFDIGILLSNPELHKEGISNSIMEYMASSLPVIATDDGGTPEIVKDGSTGFLVPEHDINIVTKRIIYLLDNNQKAVEMGINSRKIIERNFSVHKMGQSYLNLYKEVIRKNL
jgi:glycosyltransferase involved in cell wall biosynthesis